ncbi:uncharacterized protein DDB_G0287625 isoform X2 [Folsomia candida]|uniref:uncharacterized protein DDB_G0287625 isoform X2 n=1 Tax=Folsomia candida TaxID=158441 RepID=UPI000B8F169B|nr:uncharacterized protein DDB_G0287625 isoform X2 [Folsomia candida]
MERARHRLRRLALVASGCGGAEKRMPENERQTVFRFRKFSNFSGDKFIKVCLVSSAVIYFLCLSSHPVLSAEVGINTGQRSGGGGGSESNSSLSHLREILHRGESSRSKGGGDDHGESAFDRSISESKNITRDKISSHVNKHHSNPGHNRDLLHNCKNCSSTKTSGNDHVQPENEESEDSHKIEAILRDIFLDELDDNAFAQEDDDEDELENFSSSRHDILEHKAEGKSNLEAGIVSRHARSEPPLFPQGRAHQGGNNKGTRAAPGEKGKNKRADKGKNKKKVSSKGSDLSKYNEYMDAVFSRMNVMIKKKRMDPLRVNLYAGPSKTSQKKKNNKNKNTGSSSTNNKNKKRNHSPRMDLESEEEDELDEEGEETDSEVGPARKNIYLEVAHDEDDDGPQALDEDEDEIETREANVRKIRAILENAGNSSSPLLEEHQDSEGPRGNESKPKKPKVPSNKGSKSKDKGLQKGNNKKNNKNSQSQEKDKNKNKNKKQAQQQAQRTKPTRGILHGLSSLKRDGNVAVIRQGDKVRIVRANFILGPVALEILPKTKKSEDSDDSTKPVAATATASKLKGILEVRLKKGAPTQIRKLRVFPPKSVKVNGTAGSSGSTTTTTGGGKRKPQQYGKVTPMATARLRQVASTVVKQTDSKRIQPPISK